MIFLLVEVVKKLEDLFGEDIANDFTGAGGGAEEVGAVVGDFGGGGEGEGGDGGAGGGEGGDGLGAGDGFFA